MQSTGLGQRFSNPLMWVPGTIPSEGQLPVQGIGASATLARWNTPGDVMAPIGGVGNTTFAQPPYLYGGQPFGLPAGKSDYDGERRNYQQPTGIAPGTLRRCAGPGQSHSKNVPCCPHTPHLRADKDTGRCLVTVAGTTVRDFQRTAPWKHFLLGVDARPAQVMPGRY